MAQEQTSQRKTDHIDLALKSQLSLGDSRFMYEPMLGTHPELHLKDFGFLGKKMMAPIWASSMTGGAAHAKTININLAKACGKYGLGMGLGSCRIILNDNTYLEDFQMRKYIGDDFPFYANLGIAQIEKINRDMNYKEVLELIKKTETDGLIIHVNPFQEWLQPEGDAIHVSPIASIRTFIQAVDIPIIVKEVGQGMGPNSLKALLELPIAAIDFGAFGGTNFSLLELLRRDDQKKEAYQGLANIGHTAEEMVEFCNQLLAEHHHFLEKEIIISGGVSNFLDGYYLTKKLNANSVYAHASVFLQYAAIGFDALDQFIETQVKGLALANQYLTIKA